MTTPEGGFDYRVEVRDGHVYVWQRGTFRTIEELKALQKAIEHALVIYPCQRVLFDNREATQAEMDVRAHMWTWLTTTRLLKKAAVLAHSARVTKRAERTADINRVVLRAFQTEDEALAWLCGA